MVVIVVVVVDGVSVVLTFLLLSLLLEVKVWVRVLESCKPLQLRHHWIFAPFVPTDPTGAHLLSSPGVVQALQSCIEYHRLCV